MRSYVVKRLLHFRHSRRRRMESASLLSRESTTLSLRNPQKGHFIGKISESSEAVRRLNCSRRCSLGLCLRALLGELAQGKARPVGKGQTKRSDRHERD